VFLVFAVAGFFAWRFFFGGFSFPDEINGQPRLDGEQAERLSRLIEDIGAMADAEMEVAVYGQGPLPTYAMYVAEFDDPAMIDLAGFVELRRKGALKRGETVCQDESNARAVHGWTAIPRSWAWARSLCPPPSSPR